MSDYICDEILIEILLKFSIKSLIRLTSVCKAWKSLITSPLFTSLHLHLANTENHFLLRHDDNKSYMLVSKRKPLSLIYWMCWPVIDRRPIGFLTSWPSFDMPAIEYYRIVGSCNGVMCLSSNECLDPSPPVILWNPTVRTQVVLPQSYCVVLGFGVATNVYKVVRLVYYRKTEAIALPRAQIFTLGTGMWRNLGAAGITDAWVSLEHGHSTFFKGFLHWIVVKKSTDGNEYYSILTFDVGDEVFGEIVLPEDLKTEISSTLIGESFGAINNILKMGKLLCDVWMMEDYGVKESWTKLYRIDFDGFERVIGFFENSELLLSINRLLFIYNAKTKAIKPTWYEFGNTYSLNVHDFKESLLLLGYSEESQEESSLGANSTISS